MIADADGRARHITRQTTITGMRMTHIIRKIIPPAPPDDFPLPAPRRAMAESVLRLYLDQYKIENTYSLMKSGFGGQGVSAHPLEGERDDVRRVIATLICDIIDAMRRCHDADQRSATFKRSSRSSTVPKSATTGGPTRCMSRVHPNGRTR